MDLLFIKRVVLLIFVFFVRVPLATSGSQGVAPHHIQGKNSLD